MPLENLCLQGSKPPLTAAARASISRAANTGAAGDDAVSALMGTLVQKMREKFGEEAADVRSQEMIAGEVRKFITASKSISEVDIGNLEARIRQRLAGGTPVKNCKVAERAQRVANDEWARIWLYEAERVQIEEGQQRARLAKMKEQQRSWLDSQVAIRESQKKQEESVDKAHYLEQVDAWKKYDSAEVKKKEAQMAAIDVLKAERKEQLDDRNRRRQQALDRMLQEDKEMVDRMAWEMKMEMEREEATRVKAKTDLKAFLLSNEVNKEIKAKEKQKLHEEEMRYARAHEEMLDKQEANRKKQLEKLLEIQRKQAVRAEKMPEYKRWMDNALIEKAFRQREAAEEAEDARRRQHLLDVNQALRSDLDRQLVEREAARKVLEQQEQKASSEYLSTATVLEDREREEKRRQLQKRIQYRLELEAQIRKKSQEKQVAPMSETEKLINYKLLKNVDEFLCSGTMPGK